MATISDGRAHPAGEQDPRDVTELIDKGMPKHWTCPHCYTRQETGKHAEEILLEHFKYIEHCTQCGYLHLWRLRLTEEFKRGVIDMLTGGKR